jgi:hypothetical protein
MTAAAGALFVGAISELKLLAMASMADRVVIEPALPPVRSGPGRMAGDWTGGGDCGMIC